MKSKVALFFLLLTLCSATIIARQTGYDAEYLKLNREYVLNRDGSIDYHFRKEIRLLTHYSFHNLFGESFIVYNPEYQKVRVNESYTIMADGKKIITPGNAYNELLPSFAADAADYAHLRELVVTHTGTEVGAVIVLDYTITTAGGFSPYLSGMEEIGEIVPVREMSFTVRVPSGKTLQYRLLRGNQKPEIVKQSGQTSYNWHFRDLPAVPHSPLHDSEQKSYILFSTAAGLDRACAGFINQPLFNTASDRNIKQRVDRVLSGGMGETDIILTLQKIVAEEIRTVDVPMQYTGYRLRTPGRVWQSACGTPPEKARILSMMLEMAGISARTAAYAPETWFSREVGALEQLGGFFTEVSTEQTGKIYLPVTGTPSQNLLQELNGKVLITLESGTKRIKPYSIVMDDNELEMTGNLNLSADKVVSGRMAVTLSGLANPSLRLYADSLYLRRVLAGGCSDWGQAEISMKEITAGQTTASVGLRPGKLQNDYSGFFMVDLPRLVNGFEEWNLRQFPFSDELAIKLKYPLRESYHFTIEIPGGWQMVSPAENIVIINDLGKLEISFVQMGNSLVVKRSWELKQTSIDSDNLNCFREMVAAWLNPHRRTVLIQERSPEQTP